MDFYVGGSGKGHSWCLVSDCPFVAQDEESNEFISIETIEEAMKYYEQDARYIVYVWNAGQWEKIHFLVTKNKPTKSIGFTP